MRLPDDPRIDLETTMIEWRSVADHRTTLRLPSERHHDEPAGRDPRATQRIFGGAEDWNNGLHGIGTTSSQPPRDRIRSAADSAARAACRVDG